jgi:nucleoside phosphorylase
VAAGIGSVKISLHQAVFGELNRAHGTLAHSGVSSETLADLEGRTDLPVNAPHGVAWHPYLSGLRVGDQYVLSRTWPDEIASRSGMVVTHSLVASAEEIGRVDDIRCLIGLLPQAPQRPRTLTPLELDLDQPRTFGVAIDGGGSPQVGALVRALLANSSGETVGWLGEEGFESAVAHVWERLWPLARLSFTFRLSFRPDDIGDESLTIACVPQDAEMWWSQAPMARSGDVLQDASLAEEFLVGGRRAQELEELLKALGGNLTELSDLRRLERIFEYLQLGADINADNLRSLARHMASLSPDPSSGKEIKVQTITSLARLTREGGVTGIRALDNLDSSAFPRGPELLSEVVENWTREAMERGDVSEAFLELLESGLARPEGRASSIPAKVVKESLAAWRTEFAELCWKWWVARLKLMVALGDSVPDTPDVEGDLAAACPPSLETELGDRVLEFSRSRKWYALHAVAAAASRGPQQAVAVHLEFDKSPRRLAGVRALAGRMGGVEFLEFALPIGQMRLVRAAGELIAADPQLRRSLDLDRDPDLRAWERSLSGGVDSWVGISEPEKVVKWVLARLQADEPVEPAAVTAVAESAFADLSGVTAFDQVWSRLTEAQRVLFLGPSADGWLDRFIEGERPAVTPAGRLRQAITESRRVLQRLDRLTAAPTAMLRLFDEFPELDHRLFETWLGGLEEGIETDVAKQIGSVVASRGWKSTARKISGEVGRSGRTDLQAALRECEGLLGIVDRLFLPTGLDAESKSHRPASTVRRPRKAVVATALRLEFEAVAEHLQDREEVQHRGSIYERGFFEGKHSTWDVLVLEAGAGNATIGVELERAISYANPECTLFVGVAAGRKDARIGDVVAGTKIYGYESGRAEEQFKPRPAVGESSYGLVQHAKAIARHPEGWIERLGQPDDRFPEPRAHVGPIAAGEKLVASTKSTVFKLLEEAYGDTLAIEMEGFGASRAAYANPATDFLVVRGISDRVDGKSEADAAGSQEVAARRAACFGLEVLSRMAT